MSLQNVMYSERNPSQKTTYYITPFLQRVDMEYGMVVTWCGVEKKLRMYALISKVCGIVFQVVKCSEIVCINYLTQLPAQGCLMDTGSCPAAPLLTQLLPVVWESSGG